MRNLHEWSLSYAEARRLQTELAGRVQLGPLKQEPDLIAGPDCAFSKDGGRISLGAKDFTIVGRQNPVRSDHLTVDPDQRPPLELDGGRS
jgi:deoxyinosine 3'endonuclease (endonuclease V)